MVSERSSQLCSQLQAATLSVKTMYSTDKNGSSALTVTLRDQTGP